MTRLKWIALIALPAALPAISPGREGSRVEDQQTIRRTFDVSRAAGPQKLTVDNFSGYIHVTGYDGREIRMTALRTNQAESNATLAEAKREVTLDATQDDNTVRLYVDGPFRHNSHGDRPYEVIFDFDLEVPRGTELALKGFNHGTIEVKSTDGDFDIHGFNGGVDLEQIAGSGTVHTFNGPVKVAFRRNPERRSEFKTFNGSVDVYFPSGLNANLQLKTFHGGIYSDESLGPLTIPASSGWNRGGTRSVRAGNGGPVLLFDTFNGAIRLHSKTL